MDKKKAKIMIIAFVFSLALAVPVSYSVGANSQGGAAAAAGSREDPIVTASYVAKYVAEALSAHRESSPSYELVTLTRDQRIYARSGTVELIVRPGSRARVTFPGSDNIGIADLTSGQEHTAGEIVPVNHLLLIPRADKRGLVVLSAEAYILVRGDYEIE